MFILYVPKRKNPPFLEARAFRPLLQGSSAEIQSMKKAFLKSRGTLCVWQRSDFRENPEPSNHDHANEKRQVQRGQADDVTNALLIRFDAFGRNVILEDG
jgi:hypothetical protein